MILEEKRKFCLLVAILILGGLLGIGGVPASSEAAGHRRDYAAEYFGVHCLNSGARASRDRPIELTLPGNIDAVHQTTLNARVTGYISQLAGGSLATW